MQRQEKTTRTLLRMSQWTNFKAVAEEQKPELAVFFWFFLSVLFFVFFLNVPAKSTQDLKEASYRAVIHMNKMKLALNV